MGGLTFCYTCFGFASTFFNVIGSFAPLVAFPVEYVGKVSACIQVCMSLGITIQTQAYYLLAKLGGDPVMCIVFYFSSRLLKKSEEVEEGFLNCMGRLSEEVSVSGTELESVFGMVNALGRLLVCLPLDYTRALPRLRGGAGSMFCASKMGENG
eukprot:Skav214016  [mRNA]  locus=scaffold1070:430994:435452:- [translate_table: standard]